MAVLTGIPKRLASAGIDEQILQSLLVESNEKRLPFVKHAAESGKVPSGQIASAASEEFGLPLLDLSAFDTEAIPEELNNIELIEKHRLVPLMARGSRLYVAQADPTQIQPLDDFKFSTGLNVEPVIVEHNKLEALVEKLINAQDSGMDDLGSELDDVDLEDPDAADKEAEAATNANSGDDAPIVRFVNKMLLDAIKMGSSDIHFEPYEKRYRVRYRTDGVLHEVANPPASLTGKIAARLKVMSQMDISERRIPQDGRIKMRISKSKAIDFRVNTLPTLFGEKIVLRILDQSILDAINYCADPAAVLRSATRNLKKTP